MQVDHGRSLFRVKKQRTGRIKLITIAKDFTLFFTFEHPAGLPVSAD
jgi:hypothetical protein